MKTMAAIKCKEGIQKKIKPRFKWTVFLIQASKEHWFLQYRVRNHLSFMLQIKINKDNIGVIQDK